MIDAAILVGGRGSRLGKITKYEPKPLLKVEKIRFLDLIISNLLKIDKWCANLRESGYPLENTSLNRSWLNKLAQWLELLDRISVLKIKLLLDNLVINIFIYLFNSKFFLLVISTKIGDLSISDKTSDKCKTDLFFDVLDIPIKLFLLSKFLLTRLLIISSV